MNIHKYFRNFLIFSPLVFLLFLAIMIQASPAWKINPILSSDFYTTDGAINSIVVGPNEKTYIGGSFSYFGLYAGSNAFIDKSTGILIKEEKEISTMLDISGDIYTSVSDGNGGLYIGGDFDSINDDSISNIAHINSDYSIDNNFYSGIDGIVYSMALDDKGDLYIGGSFTDNKSGINNLEKLASGTVDTNFTPDLTGTVYSLLLSSTGLYVGGNFSATSSEDNVISNFASIHLTTGAVSDKIDFDPVGTVYSIAKLGDRLYIGGDFTQFRGYNNQKLVEVIMEDGAPPVVVEEFRLPINGTVFDINIDDNTGLLYIGGDFDGIGDNLVSKIAKMDVDGNLDKSFSSGEISGTVKKIVLDGDFLYAGGSVEYVNDKKITISKLIKIDAVSGKIADEFIANPDSSVNTILVRDNNLFIGGTFDAINGIKADNLVRLDDKGAIDLGFTPNPRGVINTMVSDGRDNLYVGGSFDGIGGEGIKNLAKIDFTTDVIDASFVPIIPGTVNSIALDGDALYVGGDFDGVDGENINNLAKINAVNGGVDSDFILNPDGPVNTILLSSGNLYVGGKFSNINLQSVGNLARINLTTLNIDQSFNLNPNGSVNKVLLDGNILYVGGEFSNIGGISINNLARVNTEDLNIDSQFVPNPNGVVNTMLLDNNNLYIGGNFTLLFGQNIMNLGRIDKNTGSVDKNFAFNPYKEIYTININGDNLCIGGDQGFLNIYEYLSLEGDFIKVDLKSPTIEILGKNPIDITKNSKYTDDGATAIDANDRNISSSISVSDNVNTAVLGSYNVTYSVSDSFGNSSSAQRLVNVVEGSVVDTASEQDQDPASISKGREDSSSVVYSTSPKNPSPSLENPKGELTFIINNNNRYTYSRIVKLNFFAGPDTKKIAISENYDFKNSITQDYSDSIKYNISSVGFGQKPIYVKFYSEYGIPSSIISKSIVLQEEIRPVVKDIVIDSVKQIDNQVKTIISKPSINIIQKQDVGKIITPVKQEVKVVSKTEVINVVNKIESSTKVVEKSLVIPADSKTTTVTQKNETKEVIKKNILDIKNILQSVKKVVEPQKSEKINTESREKVDEQLKQIQTCTQNIEKAVWNANSKSVIIKTDNKPVQINETTNKTITVTKAKDKWKIFFKNIFKF